MLNQMRGQPVNVTNHYEPKEPKQTFYQSTMKGLQGEKMFKMPGLKTSILNNTVIPDPITTEAMKQRKKKMDEKLGTMTSKMFMYTGDNWQ